MRGFETHFSTGDSLMTREFHQVTWDAQLRADWQRLLELAVHEDLGQQGDWTSRALVPEDGHGPGGGRRSPDRSGRRPARRPAHAGSL